MVAHETVREMTQGQLKDIIATMVGAIPSLSFDEAKGIIGEKKPFVSEIREIFEKRRAELAAVSTRHKLVPQGWTIVEDTKRKIVPIDELELFAFLKKGENWISSEEMRRRAKEAEADFGLDQAEYLLKNQGKIPEEYRPFYLPFPGTVLRTPVGDLHVPCFHWDGDRWNLHFCWLGLGWNSRVRLLRRK